MANKITLEEIKLINDLYYECHNYSEVARRLNRTPGTVKKYVNVNYIPKDKLEIIRLDKTNINEINYKIFEGLESYGELCVLSNNEKEELKKFWEELQL